MQSLLQPGCFHAVEIAGQTSFGVMSAGTSGSAFRYRCRRRVVKAHCSRRPSGAAAGTDWRVVLFLNLHETTTTSSLVLGLYMRLLRLTTAIVGVCLGQAYARI